jgi:hypothetical protein
MFGDRSVRLAGSSDWSALTRRSRGAHIEEILEKVEAGCWEWKMRDGVIFDNTPQGGHPALAF